MRDSQLIVRETSDAPIVWMSGVNWDDVPGTDKRMAQALSDVLPVVWVDPPGLGGWAGWSPQHPYRLQPIGKRILRLRVPALPGSSRSPIRPVTAAIQRWTVVRGMSQSVAPYAIVVANPMSRFPPELPGTRVLYLTDDWLAGASLMGFSEATVRAVLTSNARQADAIAGVTEPLIERLRSLGALAPAEAIIPNGAPEVEPIAGVRQPIAGVVGQLNERLDIDCLEAVVDARIPLRLIGPRTDRDPKFRGQLDRLLTNANVAWTDRLDTRGVALQLGSISVGLTPYKDSVFNRASFPLKTLEYLAAGVPVVSTDLAASRWLDTQHVVIAETPQAFAAAVRQLLESQIDDIAKSDAQAERIKFAAMHNWHRRAEALLRLIVEARNAPS